MNNDDFTKRAIIITFCAVMVAVFGTMLYGLFESKVENADIFKLITHAFDMVLVSLTSYLGGRAAAKNDS